MGLSRRFRMTLAACAAGLFLFSLAGCSGMGLDIPNPFSSTSDVNDVYFSQFPDVPIPADMKSSPKNTLVTPTQDGVKMGLETFEGRVEASSLANAMIHNMSRQGWSLRGSITGKRTMQLHEKDQRYAIIYLYDQTLSTAMEIWVLNRLSGTPGLDSMQGSFSLPASSSSFGSPGAAAGGSAPYSPPASMVTEEWEGGVSARQLAQ